MELRVERQRGRLGAAVEKLAALSPLRVLARGYAVVRRPDGGTLTRAGEAAVGDRLAVQLRDGRLDVTVDAVAEGAGVGLGPAP
jgi:exodeoxyribonuclease VII large subunit